MDTALAAFLVSFGAVVLAEMGDKTQLLAMAFAVKYNPLKVLAGVLIATVLNHALAVAAGSLLAQDDALRLWIQLAASLSFIFFGLWSLRGDRLKGEEKKKSRFGPVVTVAIAFFIAELGDKTQLATIALAAKYPGSPVFVLMGTTTGMLVADGLGILISVVFCRRIPERTVKLVSAAVFILFGLYGIAQTAVDRLGWSIAAAAGVTAALALAAGFAAWRILRGKKDGA
jgi:putative Ca2+/H+ antiporter (TMEM165/GDT1 family)